MVIFLFIMVTHICTGQHVRVRALMSRNNEPDSSIPDRWEALSEPEISKVRRRPACGKINRRRCATFATNGANATQDQSLVQHAWNMIQGSGLVLLGFTGAATEQQQWEIRTTCCVKAFPWVTVDRLAADFPQLAFKSPTAAVPCTETPRPPNQSFSVSFWTGS